MSDLGRRTRDGWVWRDPYFLNFPVSCCCQTSWTPAPSACQAALRKEACCIQEWSCLWLFLECFGLLFRRQQGWQFMLLIARTSHSCTLIGRGDVTTLQTANDFKTSPLHCILIGCNSTNRDVCTRLERWKKCSSLNAQQVDIWANYSETFELRVGIAMMFCIVQQPVGGVNVPSLLEWSKWHFTRQTFTTERGHHASEWSRTSKQNERKDELGEERGNTEGHGVGKGAIISNIQ